MFSFENFKIGSWGCGSVAHRRQIALRVARLVRGYRGTLAIGTLLLSACNGWPDPEPYRYPQAERLPEKYPTYAATHAEAAPMFIAGNRRYMVLPAQVNLRNARTRPVGAAGSASVFALEGDESPYATLFARTQDGGWRAVGVID